MLAQVGAGHVLFQMRKMVLTSKSLFFARPGINMVIDFIDLLSIKAIKDQSLTTARHIILVRR